MLAGFSLWAALVVSLAAPAASAATPQRDLQAALAKPISPGSVAMLLPFAGAPEVHVRWAAALRDGRAETRAATARVVSVAAAASLLPDTLAALQAEDDVGAARELMRAAAALGGSNVDPALFAAAARLEGRLTHDLIVLLDHRWSGPDRPLVWPATLGRRAGPLTGTEPKPRGTQEGREVITRILTKAVRDGDTDLLELALRVALATGTDPDVGTLRAALETPAREATCWYLTLVEPRRLPTRLNYDAATPPSEGELPFGCEVLGRIVEHVHPRPQTERDWTSPLAREAAKSVPLALVVLEALSPAEREAISAARGEATDHLDRRLESLRREPPPQRYAPRRPPSASAPDTLGLMDLSYHPRGFVADLLSVTGCKGTKHGLWGGAEITYEPDGRPLTIVTFEGNQALGACQSAARLLFMTALGPPLEVAPRTGRHVSFVRLDRDALACALSREPISPKASSSEASVRVGGTIEEPKKTKHVAPIYPDVAKHRRVQGTVVLEAVISPVGCVSGASVIKSIDPALDMAALRAVSDWRYTPTLLNGVAVSVLMTVTVNFRLS